MDRVTNGRTLRASVYVDRRVLVVRLSGILKADALADLGRALFRTYSQQVSAFVVDFSGGVLVSASWELARIGSIPMHGAFVAKGDTLEALRLHALRRETEGIVRMVTPDLQEAISWASGDAQGEGIDP